MRFDAGPKGRDRHQGCEAEVAAKRGAVEFYVENAGLVHAGIGKMSLDEQKRVENTKVFAAVSRAKPTGAEGTDIRRIAVTSTMGPGVKVEPSSVLAA